MAPIKFLRVCQVISVTGLSRMTIWRLERSGGFPLRRQLGPRSVAWLQSDVEGWIKSRPVVLEAGRIGNGALRPLAWKGPDVPKDE